VIHTDLRAVAAGAILEHFTAYLPTAGAPIATGGSVGQYAKPAVFTEKFHHLQYRHVSCICVGECASRVPTEFFSAGPREAVQAPCRAGYTAG
jgi:hypothetical protein